MTAADLDSWDLRIDAALGAAFRSLEWALAQLEQGVVRDEDSAWQVKAAIEVSEAFGELAQAWEVRQWHQVKLESGELPDDLDDRCPTCGRCVPEGTVLEPADDSSYEEDDEMCPTCLREVHGEGS